MKTKATWKRNRKEVSLDDLLKEMWKTIEKGENATGKVMIKADPKIIEVQRNDLNVIEKALDSVKTAQEHDFVYIHAAIAVGYANAMQAHGVIDEDELHKLNAMIGVIAERRLIEVDQANRKSIFKAILNFKKVIA